MEKTMLDKDLDSKLSQLRSSLSFEDFYAYLDIPYDTIMDDKGKLDLRKAYCEATHKKDIDISTAAYHSLLCDDRRAEYHLEFSANQQALRNAAKNMIHDSLAGKSSLIGSTAQAPSRQSFDDNKTMLLEAIANTVRNDRKLQIEYDFAEYTLSLRVPFQVYTR